LATVTIAPRRAAAAGVTFALASALAACGGGSGAASHGTLQGGHVESVHAGSLTATRVASDETNFGFTLFRTLCVAQPTSNLTLSPASAAEALGMLDAGSAGQTRAAIGKLLQLPDWSSAVVAAVRAQSAALSKISQITVSNHVFEQQGLSPTPATLNDLQTAYGADLRQLDFRQEPTATNTINAVISGDTHGMIPRLFGQPLDPTTRTVLANAILLDATWQDPFPTSRPGTFHSASGPAVTATMMQNPDGAFASRTADGWQSVVLPYVGNLQAVALLPPVHTEAGMASGAPVASRGCETPTLSGLRSLTSGPSQSAGVVLPKLSLSQTLPLTDVLAKLGLPLTGDYSGLGAGDSQISQVVQKVVMKVDQKGTKAAAATGIGITTLAVREVRTVTFDRPFLLLLEDTATHTPLFLARVADPTGS
jgi:serpin B